MNEPVVEVENAAIVRAGREVFSAVNWTLREGEAWAIVGPTGSGKTTFAEMLLGRQHLQSGVIHWPLIDRLRQAGDNTGEDDERGAIADAARCDLLAEPDQKHRATGQRHNR